MLLKKNETFLSVSFLEYVGRPKALASATAKCFSERPMTVTNQRFEERFVLERIIHAHYHYLLDISHNAFAMVVSSTYCNPSR